MDPLRVSFSLVGLAGDDTPVAELDLPRGIDARLHCPRLPAADRDLPAWHPAPAELVALALDATGYVPTQPVARWELACQRLYRKG